MRTATGTNEEHPFLSRARELAQRKQLSLAQAIEALAHTPAGNRLYQDYAEAVASGRSAAGVAAASGAGAPGEHDFIVRAREIAAKRNIPFSDAQALFSLTPSGRALAEDFRLRTW